MIKKKYVVISLLAFCLTATLFIATVTSGKKESPWDVISELQTKVNTLNASNLDLLNRVETLEGQLPQQGFLTAPAYDSGWVDLWGNWGTRTFEHGLNTTDVFVYILRNHSHYGIQPFWIYYQAGVDEYWRPLTTQNITLTILMAGGTWDEIRIMMWIISEP